MRIPALAAGVFSWLILSRRVLLRLGPGVRGLGSDRIAIWTAGAVFLAAWLPFNNGLRPEPLIAFGVLATWMLMETRWERGVCAAAPAVIVAVFSVTLAPRASLLWPRCWWVPAGSRG